MPDQPLLHKSALVTGGARRIGRQIALTLARAGAEVAITYRNSKPEADSVVREIEALGRRAIAIECDISSESSVKGAVAAAVEQFCRLDVLVNNAAIFESAPLDSMTVDQWDAMFASNTRGPFLVTREALPALRAAQPIAQRAEHGRRRAHEPSRALARCSCPRVSSGHYVQE